jgi:integrase
MRNPLRLRQGGEGPWVFPSKRAACGHLTTIAKQWNATVEAVNLKAAELNLSPVFDQLTLYCARHTFATDMLGEGMNVVEVKELMGHESLSTTMKYLHPDTSQAATTVNQRDRKSMHLVESQKKATPTIDLREAM